MRNWINIGNKLYLDYSENGKIKRTFYAEYPTEMAAWENKKMHQDYELSPEFVNANYK